MLNYEIRDNKLHISGYVNAVERDSKVIMTRDGRCVEQIAAGAFSKSLADGHEVRMKLNHKRDIGSTADGTLELREDKIGLYAEAETEDEELRELAANGKLTGWSFGFVKREGVMEQRGKDVPRRRINALDLSEVSILSVTPAYDGTSVECRAEEVETRSYDDYESAENGAQADDSEIRGRVQYFLMKEKIKQLKGQQRIMEVRYLVEEAKRKQAEYEERYNPYHDPHNGQFTSGGVGGSAAMAIGALYVPKGWAGRGQYLGSSSKYNAPKKAAISYEEYTKKMGELSKKSQKIYNERKKATKNLHGEEYSKVWEEYTTKLEAIGLEQQKLKHSVPKEYLGVATTIDTLGSTGKQAALLMPDGTYKTAGDTTTYTSAQKRLNRQVSSWMGHG